MDCNTNHIPTGKQLEAMLRTSGNLVGLPIVAVTGHTDNALNCNNNHLTDEELLRLCIGVDSCGKPAIRVKFINSCTTLKDCNNKSEANPFRRAFAYDSTTKTYALVINQSS